MVAAGCAFLSSGSGALLVMAAAVLTGVRGGIRSRRSAFLISVWSLAAGLLAAGHFLGQPASAGSVEKAVRTGFDRIWTDLAKGAATAAAGVESLGTGSGTQPAGGVAVFDLLESTAPPGTGLILYDPDGAAVAWAGEPLLHEPPALAASDGPGPLLDFRAGHSAITLYALSPVEDSGRPFRVLAGRSFPTERLPVGDPRIGPGEWTMEPVVAELPPGGRIVSTGSDRPAVAILEAPAASEWGRRLRRLALGLIGLSLVVGALADFASEGRRRATTPLLTVCGVFLVARGEGWSAEVALLGVSAALAAWASFGFHPRTSPSASGALRAGIATVLTGLGIHAGESFGLFVETGPTAELARTVSFALLMGATWVVTAPARSSRESAPSVLPVAVALLLCGAAFHDLPVLWLVFLGGGGMLASSWWSARPAEGRVEDLLVLGVLAALGAGTALEAGRRAALRQSMADLLPLLAPPSIEELADAERTLMTYFLDRDLLPSLSPAASRFDGRDLAFRIWRRSPLPLRDGLSALVVDPVDAAPSTFAFGLSLDSDAELVPEPEGWQVPPTLDWTEAGVAGRLDLRHEGETWARARFWWLPRPGFRLDSSEIEEFESALVRGRPARKGVDGLDEELRYSLYDPSDGLAIVSPWEESPPVDLAAIERRRTWIETPDGRSWWSATEGIDGLRLVSTRVLDPVAGTEKVGRSALASGLALSGLLLLVLFVARPGLDLRDRARGAVRSYSHRLLIVTTALLLFPLVTLNLVLLRAWEERLREAQIAEGMRALGTARESMVEFLLRLEPGFGLETLLDGQKLEELAEVVQHQVNFYWDGRVRASSQQELFTSGLLPARIPGEIFARLQLLGYRAASRTRIQGDAAYSELYAPLLLPGTSSGADLFISIPLLAQEREVSEELDRLRARAALATALLVLLVLAAGSRLTKSFTRPLEELIAGTRRIARGARSAGVRPRDAELASLAEAIDVMAERIASQREELLREKDLVDGIVENITSAVVSVDEEGRVALQNGTAAQLLRTRVGESLIETLGAEGGETDELVRLVKSGPRLARSSLRLTSEDGQPLEWSAAWIPFSGGKGRAGLLVVEDATDLLRAERLEAWAEMARIIAHEIKNPLTPIRLSAEHLRQVRSSAPERLDAIFDRCIDNILTQVEELRQIAGEFSTFSRIPDAELEILDLRELVVELVEEYGTGAAGRVRWVAGHDTVPCRLDRRLLRRGLRNIVENALRAMGGSGELEVHLEVDERSAPLVRVLDQGPGVRPDHLARIFEPYFSTSEGGTGLGLAITRRIVEEHGGTIEARNRDEGGLEVRIRFPPVPEVQG